MNAEIAKTVSECRITAAAEAMAQDRAFGGDTDYAVEDDFERMARVGLAAADSAEASELEMTRSRLLALTDEWGDGVSPECSAFADEIRAVVASHPPASDICERYEIVDGREDFRCVLPTGHDGRHQDATGIEWTEPRASHPPEAPNG